MTVGIKDYSEPGTAELQQYEIIDIDDFTPAGYKRIFESSNEKMFPWIENDGGEESSTDDGGKKYTFSGGSTTGYRKSTITLSGHSGVNAATGSVTIYLRAVGGGGFYADARDGAGNPLGSPLLTSATLQYNVSTPPSGGGSSGSVTVHPMTKFLQRAIKPASVRMTPPEEKTITVLAQQTKSIESIENEG